MSKKRIVGMTCDSWDECVSFAVREHERCGQSVVCVEYQERNSVDGMMFYEACSVSTADMLAQNYIIIRRVVR